MKIGINGHDTLFYTSPRLRDFAKIKNYADFQEIPGHDEILEKFYEEKGAVIMIDALDAIKKMSKKHELYLLMAEEGSEYITNFVHSEINYFKTIYFGEEDKSSACQMLKLDMLIDSNIHNIDSCGIDAILFNPYGWFDNLHEFFNYHVVNNWPSLREFQ